MMPESTDALLPLDIRLTRQTIRDKGIQGAIDDGCLQVEIQVRRLAMESDELPSGARAPWEKPVLVANLFATSTEKPKENGQ